MFKFKKLSKKEMKKMNIIDICHEVGGVNDAVAREILEESGNNFYLEMLKLDKNFVANVSEENVYHLKYKNYDFPISKYLYSVYCKNYGFMSDEDIATFVHYTLYCRTYDIDNVIKNEGVLRVAGELNYVLLNFLYFNKNSKRAGLLENELGYTFVFGNKTQYAISAWRFVDYKNNPYTEDVWQIIKKWREYFKENQISQTRGYSSYITLYVSCKSYKYTLTSFEFDAETGIFNDKIQSIIADFEKIGCKVESTRIF